MPLQIALSSDSSSTLVTHAYPMLLASVTMSLLLFYIRYTDTNMVLVFYRDATIPAQRRKKEKQM